VPEQGKAGRAFRSPRDSGAGFKAWDYRPRGSDGAPAAKRGIQARLIGAIADALDGVDQMLVGRPAKKKRPAQEAGGPSPAP